MKKHCKEKKYPDICHQHNWTEQFCTLFAFQFSHMIANASFYAVKKMRFYSIYFMKIRRKKSSRTAIETNGKKSSAYFCLCFEMVNSFVKYYVVYTHVPKTLPLQEKYQASSRACKSLRTNPKNECFYFSKNYISCIESLFKINQN